MLGLTHYTSLRCRQPNFSADEGYAPPPGSGAPQEAKRLWNQSFDAALKYYTSQKAPNPKIIASNTAWKRVLMDYDKGWTGKLTRRHNPNGELQVGKTRTGQPVYLGEISDVEAGKTTRLGKLIELAWIDGSGNLRIQRFSGTGLPDLAWNNYSKTLVMFPGEQTTFCEPNLTGLGPEAKMFQIWSRRKAKCNARLDAPNIDVQAIGIGDTLVYRSDKWEDDPNRHPDLEGSQEYVHQFDDNVFVEEAVRAANAPPRAIMVSGGRLDVKAGGIVH